MPDFLSFKANYYLFCLVFLPYMHLAQTNFVGERYTAMQEQKFEYASASIHRFFFQDSKGYMWGIDGDFELMRFDGHDIKSFPFERQGNTSYSGCPLWPNHAEIFEDSKGGIWISSSGTCLDRFDPVTGQFEKITNRLNQKTWLWDIMEDGQQNIWIATTNGLYCYELNTGNTSFFVIPDKGIVVKVVFEDAEKNIWAVIDGQRSSPALLRLDKTTGGFTKRINLETPPEPSLNDNRKDQAVRIDNSTSFLLLTENHLFQFNPEKGVVLPVTVPFLENEFATSLFKKGKVILVGTTHERIFNIESSSLTFEVIPAMSTPKRWNNSDSPIQNLFLDRNGAIWFGLTSRGMRKLLPQTTSFQTVSILEGMQGYWAGENVFGFNGKAWFNSRPKMKTVRNLQESSRILDIGMPGFKNDSTVYYRFDEGDKGNIWVAAFHDKGHTTLRNFGKDGTLLKTFSCLTKSENCFRGAFRDGKMKVDKSGRLWMTTGRNLCYFDSEKGQFEACDYYRVKDSPIHGFFIECLYVDRQNNLWIGSANQLKKRDGKTSNWETFNFDFLLGESVDNRINSILEDTQGLFWVATDYGLIQWNVKTDNYKIYTKKEMIPETSVLQVFEDHKQNIWIATTKYLGRYNLVTDSFFPFKEMEGVRISNWVTEVTIDKDHFIYLPTIASDMSYFHPDSLKVDTIVPPIYLTAFQLTNQTIYPYDSTLILQKSLNFTEKITLTYAQNDFTIYYTAPEYIHPNETVFAIKLEGFNDNWQEVGNKREARYTNLSPGDYTFKVKVRNHHGFWSETPRSLKITILPPWYRTWWAYALWGAIVVGAGYWFYRFQLNRRLAESEALRLKELDQAKSRLYTNITHEFRTPLTIILGMADLMKLEIEKLENSPISQFLISNVRLIRRNGKQLLNLVNQMLDLSKLESGDMPLKMVQGNVINYLKYLVESFHSYADSRDIRLHFLAEKKELRMDYDPEKLQNVVSNLLSNAIKFTPEAGDIYFQVEVVGNEKLIMQHAALGAGECLVLQIRDTGVGIPAESLPHIFDRFYQVDNSLTRRGEGTGIGLALSKELIKVMGGSIVVESEMGAGTKFTIFLPITKMAAVESALHVSAAKAANFDTSSAQLASEPSYIAPDGSPLVLLIEDNPDVQTYLLSFLSNDYRIAQAFNGQEGIDKAIDLIPDLIVSDVMMPEKDGFEVCEAVKTNELTCHIPVILLTAKADKKAQKKGLGHGADAYIAKPFDREELLIRIEKLIDGRRRMQEQYVRKGFLKNKSITNPPSLDDVFLQKIIGIVEENLSDENFGLPELCRKATTSRSQLFRKLKALTGKSTNHFIRSIRLEKAKELLETTQLSVSEISYETGFVNPAYFSRVFKEEYGMTPSEVRKD